MLTYRSIFEIKRNDAFPRIVEPEIYAWLKVRKGHDLDRLSPRWHHSADSRASLVERPYGRNGELIRRLTLEETSGYRTTVTTRSSPKTSLRFWIDVDSPVGSPPAKVPALVRNILDQTEALDGLTRLTETPALARPQDVEGLSAAIADPHRRATIFLAGTAPEIPLNEWRNLVAQVTKDTAGMSAVTVLDTEATRKFAARHSRNGFDVPPGTIRTFPPKLNLADGSEARRSKILGTARLVDDSELYLQSVLAGVVRRATVALPLSKPERDVERALSRIEITQLLGLEVETVTGETPQARRKPRKPKLKRHTSASQESTSKRGGKVHPSEPESVAVVSTEVQLHTSDLAERVFAIVRHAYTDLWNRGELDEAAMLEVEKALETDPAIAIANREQVRSMVTNLEVALATSTEELQDAKVRLEDLDLELAAALEDSQAKDRRIRELQKHLVLANLATEAYMELEADPRPCPSSFAGLANSVGTLTNIVFTCDWESVALLDDTVHAPTSRISGVWEGLVALDDYARAKREQLVTGSFYEYLKNSPPGFATIPLERFAATESKTVRNNPKMSRERKFVVPKEVDKSGSVAMVSHIKKGNETTDPRIYFFDATAKHGQIIVGYIGLHLTVKSSN